MKRIALPLVTLLHRSLRHAQLADAARLDAKTGLLNAVTWRHSARLNSDGRIASAGNMCHALHAYAPYPRALIVVVAVRAVGAGTAPNVAVATHSRRDPTPHNNIGRAVIHVTGRAAGVGPAFTG